MISPVIIGNATLSGIYRIRHVDGKVYVGSSVNVARRWIQHRSDLENRRHRCPELQAAWIKHGASAFTFEVLELVPGRSDLVPREQAWIDDLDAVNTGYNVCPVAGSNSGRKHSAETLRRLSEFQRSRPHKPCAEDTKRKISEAQRGVPKPPCTPEYRALMSSLMKGRAKPPRTLDQRARAAATQTGKRQTPEVRERMAAAQRARWARHKAAENV